MLSLVGCVVVLSGCSGSTGNTARLSGEILLDGEPLPPDALASISFQTVDVTGSARPTSTQIVNSRYDCPDVPKGKVRVFVNISIPTGKTYTTGPNGKVEDELKTVDLVAAQRQGIELDVVESTTIDIELEQAKRR